MTFLRTFHIPVRITGFLYSSRHLTCDAMQRFGLSCHVLFGKNMSYGVHRPVCFLETLCHVLPRHVIFFQTTARSLFVIRRQSPDDVTWRRAATGQIPGASATCAALNSIDAIDSGNGQRHQWMLPSEHNNNNNTEAARTNSTIT